MMKLGPYSFIFFFKQKTAYEMRISDWSSDVCSSDLAFDAKGDLYFSVGDNTDPGQSDGYSPVDERPGRSPWDAQKSSANPNDLRGKVNRIHPEQIGRASCRERVCQYV